jgi:hypothetical protein
MSSARKALSDGGSFRNDLVGVAKPLDRAGGGFVAVIRGEDVISFVSRILELVEGAGEAEDRERRSDVEADRLDESFLNMVDSFDLAL